MTMRRSAKGKRKPRKIGSKAARDEFRFTLDRHGTQHFNFEQRIWLHRSVPMAFTPVRTTALETLALNLLALSATSDDTRNVRGCEREVLIPMARSFCKQCLLGAPLEGWVLPRPVIQEWMHAQRQARRPHAKT